MEAAKSGLFLSLASAAGGNAEEMPFSLAIAARVWELKCFLFSRYIAANAQPHHPWNNPLILIKHGITNI